MHTRQVFAFQKPTSNLLRLGNSRPLLSTIAGHLETRDGMGLGEFVEEDVGIQGVLQGNSGNTVGWVADG